MNTQTEGQMQHWPRSTLGEVAKIECRAVDAIRIFDGTTYVGLENIETGGNFVNVRAVASGELSSNKFAFTEDHILYGKLRPYLAKIARPDFGGVCSTDILPILPGSGINRDYLTHFLRLPTTIQLANSRSTGANLPRVNPKDLATFEIPVPSLPEQDRIAAVLDKAESLRAKRRETISQLDELTQSVFRYFSGDPRVNLHSWPLRPLGSLVRSGDSINYGVVQPGDHFDQGVPLVRVGNLVDGRVDKASIKKIEPSIERKYRRSRLRGDEILVSCVGSIGEVALADDSVNGFNVARAVARIPLGETCDRNFISEYLRTEFVQSYFYRELRTVSQPTLNIKQIAETIVLLPPLRLQRKFARHVESIDRLKASQRAHSAELDALFASLQYRAFRGEL